MQPTTPQTLIVCGDGGLQGSFIAGALATLYQQAPEQFEAVPFIFATSASMATFVYYLTGTGPVIGHDIWTNQIPRSSFLTFTSLKKLMSGTPAYNIDYMVDKVFRENNPLNIDRIRATTHNFCFPILNLDTREVEIFSNKPDQARQFFPRHTIRNWLEYDIYDLIHACCAIPILYDRPVILGDYHYCDAGIITPYLVPNVTDNNLKALYLVVRQKTVWSHDWKLILIAALWRLRATQGKTGLPGWVYTHIARKPFTLSALTRRLRKTIPNLTLVSATTPLMSSLQNTPESALHNWHTGENHITARLPEISQFWKNEAPAHPKGTQKARPNSNS